MVIHVLYLPLDVAVNALAVGAVCELPYHAQPVRSLLPGKKLLDRYDNALPTPLSSYTHHLLPQGHLGRSRSSFFGFTPPSLQRPVRVQQRRRNRGEQSRVKSSTVLDWKHILEYILALDYF